MNKNELIARVAELADITKTDAAKVVDAYNQAVTEALGKGDEVRVVGFGTYYAQSRKATEGRNPRTGEVIKIPASRQPKFKAGKALKDACNNKKAA